MCRKHFQRVLWPVSYPCRHGVGEQGHPLEIVDVPYKRENFSDFFYKDSKWLQVKASNYKWMHGNACVRRIRTHISLSRNLFPQAEMTGAMNLQWRSVLINSVSLDQWSVSRTNYKSLLIVLIFQWLPLSTNWVESSAVQPSPPVGCSENCIFHDRNYPQCFFPFLYT